MFKMPDKIREEMYNRRYLTYRGETVHVTDFEERSLGVQDVGYLEMGRFVLGDICEKMTTDALEKEYIEKRFKCEDIKNRSVTYNDAIINLMMPEIIKRIKRLTVGNKRYVYDLNDIKRTKEKGIERLEVHYVYINDDKIKRVRDFEEESIDLYLYKELRMNNYARNNIYPKLTKETFIHASEMYVSECGGTYTGSGKNSDYLILGVFKELIKRYKEL